MSIKQDIAAIWGSNFNDIDVVNACEFIINLEFSDEVYHGECVTFADLCTLSELIGTKLINLYNRDGNAGCDTCGHGSTKVTQIFVKFDKSENVLSSFWDDAQRKQEDAQRKQERAVAEQEARRGQYREQIARQQAEWESSAVIKRQFKAARRAERMIAKGLDPNKDYNPKSPGFVGKV